MDDDGRLFCHFRSPLLSASRAPTVVSRYLTPPALRPSSRAPTAMAEEKYNRKNPAECILGNLGDSV
ncbi:hypothetical protein ACLOJK_036149 [Asimina triloba]